MAQRRERSFNGITSISTFYYFTTKCVPQNLKFTERILLDIFQINSWSTLAPFNGYLGQHLHHLMIISGHKRLLLRSVAPFFLQPQPHGETFQSHSVSRHLGLIPKFVLLS